MKESYIERESTDYATASGWLAYKFSSPARRGVPDRIYLKDGVVIFVEYKAPGKKPTKLQEAVFAKIRAKGFQVYVIDDIERAKRVFDSYA